LVTYPKARSVSVALFTVANARAIPHLLPTIYKAEKIEHFSIM